MRHSLGLALVLSALALAGCAKGPLSSRAIDSLSAVDESNLNDIMLTVAEPKEAVAYFQKAVAEKPKRVDLQRNLAKSLIRAGDATAAIKLLEEITARADSTPEDKLELAEALIRTGEWKRAQALLASLPPAHRSFKRYRLEAMVADSQKQWKKADELYKTAAAMTDRPAGVLNNWGFSKMSRGDFAGAEKLFGEAIGYDPKMFTAKNNLVMARAAQKKYALPTFDITQTERAELLHTMALTAIKSGDTATGKTLLREAVETHPQHFDAAATALRTLEGKGK